MELRGVAGGGSAEEWEEDGEGERDGDEDGRGKEEGVGEGECLSDGRSSSAIVCF